MRTLGEVVIGLVEADVAVVADAEQLQIRVTASATILSYSEQAAAASGLEPSGTCVLFRSMLM